MGSVLEKIRKEIVKELKKRKGVDLIFQENVSLGDGQFTGYTQNGISFFGQLISANGDYYFGFLDKKGKPFIFGTRTYEGDYVNGPITGFCYGYSPKDEFLLNYTFYKNGKADKYAPSSNKKRNSLFIKPLDGAFKKVMPDIHNPQMLFYKDGPCKYVYFGEVKDKKPYGYGMRLQINYSHDKFIFANWEDFEKIKEKDFAISYGDEKVYVSNGERTLVLEHYSIRHSFGPLTFAICGLIPKSTGVSNIEFTFFYKEVSCELRGTNEKQRIEIKKTFKEKDFLTKQPYAFEYDTPIQFIFALAGNLALGSIDEFFEAYEAMPERAQLIEIEKLKQLLSSQAVFKSYIDELKEQEKLDKLEKKKKKENKV